MAVRDEECGEAWTIACAQGGFEGLQPTIDGGGFARDERLSEGGGMGIVHGNSPKAERGPVTVRVSRRQATSLKTDPTSGPREVSPPTSTSGDGVW